MRPIVLFIIDTLQTGGAERSLLEITSNFKKYRPVFFQLYPGDALLPEFEKAGIEVQQFGFKPGYNFRFVARQLVSEVVKLNPVLVHSTLFRSDMVARLVCREIKTPLINSFVNNSYSIQRFSGLSFLGKLKLFGIQMWDRLTATSVDLFISNSKTIKESNSKALQIPLSKIQVIYRGRDYKAFDTVTNKQIEDLRSNLGLVGKFVFLNVSRLLNRKGQLDLVKAFHNIHKDSPDTLLLIAGEGSYRATLEEEIEKLSLENAVKLLGNRSDVAVLLKSADCFVFPSHYEGLPGALIEAMFAKKPIIASSIPENLECVTEKAAMLFSTGHIEGLAMQMRFALARKDNWSDRVKFAYEFAMNYFEIRNVASQYERVYDELVTPD